ncbi:MAG: hypothetical protein V1928_01990 [Parcubacteria group bacterium]
MCVGISFIIDNINARELDKFFLPEEFAKQRKGDMVEVFFWQSKPFLPIEEEGLVNLYPWGNRERGIRMPRTGWAKIESLRDGLWDYLSPKMVRVPSAYGYEKRKWFKTPDGIKAVRVRLHNVTRVYIVTTKADREFYDYTGHDRMPVGNIVYSYKKFN